MPIKKIKGEDEYDVDLKFKFFGDKYKWSKEKDVFSGVVGVDSSKIIILNQDSQKKYRSIYRSIDDIVSQIKGVDQKEKINKLQIQLEKAIGDERYEDASKIINVLKKYK
jgi:hypothetical protein